MPELDTSYYSAYGEGSFCNGKKVVLNSINSIEEIRREIIATGDRRQFFSSNSLPFYEKLILNHSIVRTMPDCFGHAMAIKGSVGAMVDFGINFWDFAATKLLIEEAGGKLVIQNKYTLNNVDKYNIIFGKPAIVDLLIEMI